MLSKFLVAYLPQFYRHWVVVVTGLLSVISGTLGALYGNLIALSVTVFSGLVAVLYAGFLAWVDEHEKYEAEALKNRELLATPPAPEIVGIARDFRLQAPNGFETGGPWLSMRIDCVNRQKTPTNMRHLHCTSGNSAFFFKSGVITSLLEPLDLPQGIGRTYLLRTEFGVKGLETTKPFEIELDVAGLIVELTDGFQTRHRITVQPPPAPLRLRWGFD